MFTQRVVSPTSPQLPPAHLPPNSPALLAAAGQYQAWGLEEGGLGPKTNALVSGWDRPVEPGAVWVGQQAVSGFGSGFDRKGAGRMQLAPC